MKKAILPSKTYLVCSSGMKKTETVVFSQATVRADKKNRLVATVNDRFGDFICKYALILGALVAGAIVASGGALAALIWTAAIAIGASLSMCTIINLFNGGGWQNYHPTARVEGKNVLIDKSYFSCPLGGTIIPIYDKNIADAQAAVFREKAEVEIFTSFVAGFFLGEYRAACIAAQVGFGSFMTGLGVGYVLGVGISKAEDFVVGQVNPEITEHQKSSPLYDSVEGSNEGMAGIGYSVPKATGEGGSMKTVSGAKDLSDNKEGIIDQGTNEAQGERVHPNQEGTLNNPINKNKFDKQEKAIKQQYGKHQYRRSKEWKALQEEKAVYNRQLGEAAYKQEHINNLKEGAKEFGSGLSLRTKGGRLLWSTALVETISNILIDREQKEIYDNSVDAEAKIKATLGIYANNVK